jgi:hypothetical protein
MSLLMRSIVTLVMIASLSQPAWAEDRLQFNRDIRPILSDKCFACHGNDKNKRVVDMRLDVRDLAITTKAIVPGKPDDSAALTRMMDHRGSRVRTPLVVHSAETGSGHAG